jgi:hypothetical protein
LFAFPLILESPPVQPVLVELAELLEPTPAVQESTLSTLQLTRPSTANTAVLIRGLLVAVAAGAGLGLVVAHSKWPAQPSALAMATIRPASAVTVSPLESIVPIAPPASPISRKLTVQSKHVSPRNRHARAMGSGVPGDAAPATRAGDPDEAASATRAGDPDDAAPATRAHDRRDDWVDPFVSATKTEHPRDTWVDPFGEQETASPAAQAPVVEQD